MADQRHVSAWISWSHWDQHIAGMEWKKLRDYAAVPTIKDPLHSIVLACRKYIQDICTALQTGSEYIRLEIMDHE